MTPDAPSRRFMPDPRWLALLGALFLLGGLFGLFRYESMGQIERREQERMLAQARALQFIAANTLVTANAILKDQAREWIEDMDNTAANRRLKVLDSALSGMRSLMILNRDGMTQASSREELIGRNFSERPYYTFFKDSPASDQLFVSPPFRSVLGSTVIVISRLIIDKSGTSRGVISATLDPDFFTPLLKAIRATPDVQVVMAHGEGRLFLAEPDHPEAVLMNLDEPGTVFSRHKQSGKLYDVFKGRLENTGKQGFWVVLSIQTPGLQTSSPLIVLLGRSLEGILTAWRQETLIQGLGFLLIAGVACVMLHLYLKRKRQYDQELAESARVLEDNARFIQSVTDGVPGMIGYWDKDLHCQFANHAYLEWFGKRPEVIIGISLKELLGEELYRQNELYAYAALWGEPQTFERDIQKPDGSTGYTLIRYIPDWHDGEVRGFFVLISDVTELKQTQTKLMELVTELNTQAVTDVLTGLANRRRFWEQGKLELARAARYNFPLFLVMLDIDKFKSINDGFGHAAGDMVLQNLAQTLKGVLRETDVVGRLGGEEFGILLVQTNERDARIVAERLRQTVEKAEVGFEGLSLRYTVSLGLAAAQKNETSLEELVKRADQALYKAKETGRNRVCYAEDMDSPGTYA